MPAIHEPLYSLRKWRGLGHSLYPWVAHNLVGKNHVSNQIYDKCFKMGVYQLWSWQGWLYEHGGFRGRYYNLAFQANYNSVCGGEGHSRYVQIMDCGRTQCLWGITGIPILLVAWKMGGRDELVEASWLESAVRSPVCRTGIIQLYSPLQRY